MNDATKANDRGESDGKEDAGVVHCSECDTDMEIVDSSETPGPITWECPGCSRSFRAEWYCRDCEKPLEILYDVREDPDTPVVCGSCGKTNTRLMEGSA